MKNQLKLVKDNYTNIDSAFSGDLWEREKLAVHLTDYIARLKIGATIAIDAEWGSGKTWFVNHWKMYLEDQSFDVVYLDAFKNDYLEDPFLVIASEIAAKLDKTTHKGLVYKFKKAAAALQQSLLTLTPTLIASMISCAITGGVIPLIRINSDDIKEKIDDTIDKVTDNIGEKVTEAIQNKIDNYEEEKKSLIAFKETLTELAESLNNPLVFIIDELDRCRPDFAIRLIERIKHFFDIPNVVFVLSVNKSQLTESINSYYGFKTSNNYLEKFIDFNIKLKPPEHFNYEDLINNYIQSHDFKIKDSYSINWLFIYFEPNARQSIKILQKLNFLNLVSNEKTVYGCLYMLICDLGLMNNTDDEFKPIEIFKEVVTDYYVNRIKDRWKVKNSPTINDEIEVRLANLNNGIYNLWWLYKKTKEDLNSEILRNIRNEYSPSEMPQHLNQDWDHYLNSGYVLNIE